MLEFVLSCLGRATEDVKQEERLSAIPDPEKSHDGIIYKCTHVGSYVVGIFLKNQSMRSRSIRNLVLKQGNDIKRYKTSLYALTLVYTLLEST